jgi:hypothetical protein
MKSNIPTMLSAPEFHDDMIEAAREGNTLRPEDQIEVSRTYVSRTYWMGPSGFFVSSPEGWVRI